MKTRWAGVVIAMGFMALTIPAWVALLSAPEHAPNRKFVTVLAVSYGVATIAAAFLTNTRRAPALRVLVVVPVATLGLILVVTLGAGSAPVFAPAICLMLVLLPRVAGISAVTVSLLALGAAGLLEGTAEAHIQNFLLLFSVAIATFLVLVLVEMNEQLVEAKNANESRATSTMCLVARRPLLHSRPSSVPSSSRVPTSIAPWQKLRISVGWRQPSLVILEKPCAICARRRWRQNSLWPKQPQRRPVYAVIYAVRELRKPNVNLSWL